MVRHHIKWLQTVDRFALSTILESDEDPTTCSQVDVASGTLLFSTFRKTFKITNGNQSSGAGTSDEIIN